MVRYCSSFVRIFRHLEGLAERGINIAASMDSEASIVQSALFSYLLPGRAPVPVFLYFYVLFMHASCIVNCNMKHFVKCLVFVVLFFVFLNSYFSCQTRLSVRIICGSVGSGSVKNFYSWTLTKVLRTAHCTALSCPMQLLVAYDNNASKEFYTFF